MLDTVAFFTGAALCAMLGRMQWRVDRASGGISGYLLLWVVGFAWTFGNFLHRALDLASVPADSASVKLAESLAWSCTLLGPIAIGRLLQSAIGAAHRAARAFLALTIGIAVMNLILMVRASQQHGFHVEASSYPSASFYMALGVGALALVLYHLYRPEAPARRTAPRWFVPAALAFAAVHTAAILLSTLSTRLPAPLAITAELIGQHWTIPWSILIAVSLAQAHYADVVLKRSLWLLASVCIATVSAMAVLDMTPGLPTLMAILLLTALMLVSPAAVHALNRLVDQRILDRPDYSLAAQALDHALRRASTRTGLIDAALESLRATLRVDARYTDALHVTPTHHARTLMQSELGYLDMVRTRLDHRLEALRLEDEQRAVHLREERLKRLLTEAELKALRTQVDPHFLFNTLNTIADLIGSDPAQAERMTERLAECFRYALAKHSRALSTLEEELSFARHYLDIEQVRFGERLRVQLTRGNATGSETLPSLLLQPLLENAVRHGLAPLREGGHLSVTARLDGDRLHLCVEDDGVGLRAGTEHSGVGLRNVRDRLRTLYGEQAEFIIGPRAAGRGTQVITVIPLNAH